MAMEMWSPLSIGGDNELVSSIRHQSESKEHRTVGAVGDCPCSSMRECPVTGVLVQSNKSWNRHVSTDVEVSLRDHVSANWASARHQTTDVDFNCVTLRRRGRNAKVCGKCHESTVIWSRQLAIPNKVRHHNFSYHFITNTSTNISLTTVDLNYVLPTTCYGSPSFGNVLWQLALVEMKERDTREYSTINNTGFANECICKCFVQTMFNSDNRF